MEKTRMNLTFFETKWKPWLRTSGKAQRTGGGNKKSLCLENQRMKRDRTREENDSVKIPILLHFTVWCDMTTAMMAQANDTYLVLQQTRKPSHEVKWKNEYTGCNWHNDAGMASLRLVFRVKWIQSVTACKKTEK